MQPNFKGPNGPLRAVVGGHVSGHGCTGQSNRKLAAQSVFQQGGIRRTRCHRYRRRRRRTHSRRRGSHASRSRHRRRKGRTHGRRRRTQSRRKQRGGRINPATIGLSDQASSLGMSVGSASPIPSALANPPPYRAYNHCVDATAPPSSR